MNHEKITSERSHYGRKETCVITALSPLIYLPLRLAFVEFLTNNFEVNIVFSRRK
jgi:hypothetical protein